MLALYLFMALSTVVARPDTAGPKVPMCYRLDVAAWSPSIGLDSAFHRLPALVRLDTIRAGHGGWRVEPKIAFLHPAAFPGTPRWTIAADSIQVLWSDGYAVTTLQLGPERSGIRQGVAVARSDAVSNGPLPRRAVRAHRTNCQ